MEVELQLVDSRTMALKSVIDELLSRLDVGSLGSAKKELMQCFVEVNSDARRTVDEVGDDLLARIGAVERAADGCGARLLWAGTHPFSRWRDQAITPDPRYAGLVETLQVAARRHVVFGLHVHVVFGLHVHVGVGSGDEAALACDRLRRHLPLLLALSANSPFWGGSPSGLHSHRIEVLEDSPIGGPPPVMRSWGRYRENVDRLFAAGFIRSPKDLWWDMRPNPDFGTIEVRICDMPPDLPSVLALTALIQCLVHDISGDIGRGIAAPEEDDDSLMLRQNRWRACRYGLGAEFVDPATLEVAPARRSAERLAHRLRGVAEHLGCGRHLEHLLDMAARPTGSERQLALFEQTADLAEVARRLVAGSRLTQDPEPAQALGRSDGGLDDGRPALPYPLPVQTNAPAA